MSQKIDALDELEDFIMGLSEMEAGKEPTREYLGTMTVYNDGGRPLNGKVFPDRESADNAMIIMGRMMKPQFRVNVYKRQPGL